MTLAKDVTQAFKQQYGRKPAHLVRSPGRVNLIGEHTDYNDGFVLPMAVSHAVWIASRPRDDRKVIVRSLDFEEPLEFDLDDFSRGEANWGEYVKGVAWSLQEEGLQLSGWEGVLAGDVPIGAGLSSSAALELASARTFTEISGIEWQPAQMALAAQRAENQWVGMNCGIMDQMISAVGKEGHALMIDCRSLETTPVPLPTGTTVVILDTKTRRGLVDSAYNERRAQCEAVARHFDMPALRDVDLQQLSAEKENLDDISYRRALHVVSENERVLQSAEAMQQGDARSLGKLMNASHKSMRYDFEISRWEMDLMVEIAQKEAGCLGARMTGGGFGGCAVALVARDHLDRFIRNVEARYKQKTELDAVVYVSQAAQGTSEAFIYVSMISLMTKRLARS